jgi:HSP20 family protein
MPFIKWKPWTEFEETFEPFTMLAKGWDLDADISEDAENVNVEMHLAGVKPEDIDLEINDNMLHVSGSRIEETEKQEEHYFRKEIKRGSFERAVMLPASVQADKAQATFENGVLKISFPKEKRQESKKIKIKTH